MNIANAPCSWGVLEFDLEGEVADFTKVLNEMQETGYAGTELGDWGFMPTESARLRAELARRNLALLGAFVPVALADQDSHAPGEVAALRTARLLASASSVSPFIVLADDNGKDPVRTAHAGRIRPEEGLSADRWMTFAAGANRIAASVHRETGLRTVFHHQCGGFVETPAEIETLLRLTDPARLGLCLDTGHYAFGGGDPLEAIGKHSQRIWHVHFKDCDPAVASEARRNNWDYFESVRHGIFCELGRGNVNFRRAIDALALAGYDGWAVVEQDVLPGMGSPKACAARNRTFLRSLGL